MMRSLLTLLKFARNGRAHKHRCLVARLVVELNKNHRSRLGTVKLAVQPESTEQSPAGPADVSKAVYQALFNFSN